VWGSQKAGEQGPAALRCPLALAEGDISYEVFLPAGATHTLRLQGQTKEHVLLVLVSPGKLAVTQQGERRALAETRASLPTGAWLPVRVSVRGQDLFLQVAAMTLKATQASIAEARTAFALLGYGSEIGFRRITVTRASY
jgi:hypothetical protein